MQHDPEGHRRRDGDGRDARQSPVADAFGTTPLGQEIAKEGAVARLNAFGLIVAQRPSGLASDGPGKKSAAHSDAPVNFPTFNAKPGFGQRALPGEDVRVDGIHQRSVEIEDESTHGRREPTPARPT